MSPRSAVIDIVKQVQELPPSGIRHLQKLWDKRAQETRNNSDHFDKQAQFTARDVTAKMVTIYQEASRVLDALIQKDASIYHEYPELKPCP
jgi:hypothetical protein